MSSGRQASDVDTGGQAPERRRTSDLPPSEGSARLAERLLGAEDLEFLRALRTAGLLGELAGDELLRVATHVAETRTGLGRRIDLLEAYYEGPDPTAARRRRGRDRFFLQETAAASTGKKLAAGLALIAPEVGAISLEHSGGADGPLVLRAGAHVAALLDDEEKLDTGEVDLSEVEGRRGLATVTLRGLVRAVNVLLDHAGIRERLVGLRSDAAREVYAAVTVTQAIELARGGWLEDEDVEDVMELGGW